MSCSTQQELYALRRAFYKYVVKLDAISKDFVYVVTMYALFYVQMYIFVIIGLIIVWKYKSIAGIPCFIPLVFH